MSRTTGLVRFLDTGVSSFHVAREVAARFEQGGFRRLRSADPWDLAPGDAFVLEEGGSVIAGRLGGRPMAEAGAVVAAAHTDSPGLQLKPNGATVDDGMLVVPVEVYGGPILASWIDRELALAGRVVYRDGDGLVGTAYVADRRPRAVIPNLAIHLNREINEGVSYNRQDHLRAIFGPVDGDDGPAALTTQIAELAGVPPEALLDTELFLVPYVTAATIGDQGQLLVSPRIDNLAGCFAVMEALLASVDDAAHTRLAVFFNHEEIGSQTGVGAAGRQLEGVLRRLVGSDAGGSSDAAFERAMARSVLISNDAAHGRHPNYRDKHDPAYAPRLGGGPTVKKSAIWRYVSDLEIAGWFAALAQDSGVPLQYLQNRSDIRAGSTIGPHASTRLGLRGIDVGIPILAMHSARETAAVADVESMIRVLTAAYGRSSDEIPHADTSRQV